MKAIGAKSTLKRVLSYFLLILATIAVLVLCFMMPNLTARIQDEVVDAKVSSQSMQAVFLTTENIKIPLGELLEFAAAEYEISSYTVPINAGDESKRKAAENVLDFFDNQGLPLLGGGERSYNGTPVLAVSKATDSTRMLWQYTFTDQKNNYVTLTIDDATEQMISFAVFSEGITEIDDYDEDAKGLVEPPYSSDISLPSASIYDFDFEWLLERKRSCVEILTEYYGFSEAKLVEDMVDSTTAKEGTEDFVVFIDEAGDSVRCEISFVTDRYSIFSFNRQPM